MQRVTNDQILKDDRFPIILRLEKDEATMYCMFPLALMGTRHARCVACILHEE